MWHRHIALSITITLGSLISAQAPMLNSIAQYNAAFSSTKPMIVMFSGSHCGPCKSMKPHFHSMAAEHPDIQFFIVETNDSKFDSLVDKLNIQGLPTVIFSCDGKKIQRTTGGMSKTKLQTQISEFRTKITEKPKPTTPRPAPKVTQTKRPARG